MRALGQAAVRSAAQMAQATTAQKNAALRAISAAIEAQQARLLSENAADMAAGQANQLSAALLDRLQLTPNRIGAMLQGLQQVAELSDPVGEISELSYRPSGIQVGKMRVPLGVVGIIYESRPNVTIDAASLCIKSGNATILRGGSEALRSNQVLADCVRQGLRQAGSPEAAVQVIDTPDRAMVSQLVRAVNWVDVIIPRGGKGLIERISQEARVPVIKHLDGNCHVYLDDDADEQQAIDIAYNAKTRRYGVCNAMETLLVARARAAQWLPKLAQQLQQKGVELRGCALTQQIIACKAATVEDWSTEYLDAILAIKVVDDLAQAIAHINQYGSHHTDAIVTTNIHKARQFMTQVDSSSVVVNASTAFADGFEYGLGAEIGISTDKIHARGPVGLHGLTCQKYIVLGNGHIRA